MQKRLAPLLGSNYSYPVWNRVMEISGILAYGALTVLLLASLVRMAVRLGPAFAAETVWLLPVALGVFLAADFTSGLVHCAADNFGSPDTPLFGVAFIRPFRDHHRDPLGITRHDFVETNGNSCLVNLIVMAPTLLALETVPAGLGAFLAGAAVLLFATAIVLTNQIHKWAHMPRPPRWVALLQRYNVILTPEHHAVHHAAPFDKNYCITTGWMNGVAEHVGFFGWLVRTFG